MVGMISGALLGLRGRGRKAAAELAFSRLRAGRVPNDAGGGLRSRKRNQEGGLKPPLHE